MMLLLSLILWYLTKLGYTYTAEIPVTVEIEGNRFRIECLAEGTGYRIFSHRFLRQKPVRLTMDEIQASPSIINEGRYIINPYSLQNAISVRNTDLRIISLGDLPEIEYPNGQY